jgi:hypothetical protein
MKNIVLTLIACLVLAGCSRGATGAAAKSVSSDAAPVESVLTTTDMNACEQSLGIVPPTSSSDIYTLSAESVEKVKTCALNLEKQHMPLLADLMDQYVVMLKQGDQECAKDIGTTYGDACLRKSRRDAAEWYNRAVSQRVRSELPNEPQQPVRN